ncbi:MAG: hypothetical protein JNG89_13205 [Planctomycetaceae bacterium]|nr:hypothetical protein [Planctomycetaceae bacterium]
MTFTAACGWSLLRSLLVAAVGLCGAVHLSRLGAQQRGKLRVTGWLLILAPCLAPGLIVGYGYRNYSLSLVHHPWWNEALYAAILIGQAAPVGALLLYFAPPPMLSASAVHCWRLSHPAAGLWRRAATELRGPRQAWLPAAAIMFLFAFQESEIAALMQVRGWPEWLFTRYAGLVDLTATRWRMLALVAIQALVVVPVVAWMWRAWTTGRRPARGREPPAGDRWWAWPMAACLIVLVIPSAVVLRGVWTGLATLGQQPSFWRELVQGLALAMTAGAIACTVAGGLIQRLESSTASKTAVDSATGAAWRPVLVGLLLLPGLCGSMTLALLVDDLFQQSWLRWAYDSPARIITALSLVLLPRAVLLQTCVPYDRRTSALHGAALLAEGVRTQRRGARRLDWRLRGSARFWSYVLVCSWGYLDLMIATISAPPGMEPVVKRLYNFMHFGHIAGLSAMVCVTVATPLVLASAAALLLRQWRTGGNSA